jgi:hypothetical protein
MMDQFHPKLVEKEEAKCNTHIYINIVILISNLFLN